MLRGLGSCSWPCLASHGAVCWGVLYDVVGGVWGPVPGHVWHLRELYVGRVLLDVFRGLGSCSCLASHNAECWGIVQGFGG